MTKRGYRGKSCLKSAVERTPDVKGHYEEGLHAMGSDSKYVKVPDTTLLLGSLDIDDATKDIYPDENRWDYAIEYKGEVFFIEVHAASTSEVGVMVGKLEWLKNWLEGKAPLIGRLRSKNKNAYYWVFTKKNGIIPTSSQ